MLSITANVIWRNRKIFFCEDILYWIYFSNNTNIYISHSGKACAVQEKQCDGEFKLGLGDLLMAYRVIWTILGWSTAMGKTFVKNSSFSVEWCTTGKVQFLISSSFLLVLAKFSFWGKGCALGYGSMEWGLGSFLAFPNFRFKLFSLILFRTRVTTRIQ